MVLAMAVAVVIAGSVIGGSFSLFAARGSSGIDPMWGLVVAGVTVILGSAIAVPTLRSTIPLMDSVSGLTKAERREVGRAVNGGRAVSDPKLAPAAVLFARQQQRPIGPTWVRNGVAVAIFGLVMGGIGIVAGRPVSMVSGAMFAVAGVGMNVLHRRAVRSERTNLELITEVE